MPVSRPGHAVRQLLAALAVFVAAGVGVTFLLLPSGDAPTPPAATSPEPGTSASGPPPGDEVLAVKIDNVRAARPQTGLGGADVVYVEPVEGGLTRLAAVFTGRLPEVVGPVRSARETDIQLLAQYGHPTLAYSGAAPEINPKLRRAPLNRATEQRVPRAFFRDPGRPRPHNLYVRPARLPVGTGPGPEHVLEFGPAPEGGSQHASYRVNFRAASYRFAWSGQAGHWLVSMDGTPMTFAGTGRAAASTVVVQHVDARGAGVRDAAGAVSPVARTVGSGKATVLRDGKVFHGSWSRPKAGVGTRFTTDAGEELSLADGQVWILLVPR